MDIARELSLGVAKLLDEEFTELQHFSTVKSDAIGCPRPLGSWGQELEYSTP